VIAIKKHTAPAILLIAILWVLISAWISAEGPVSFGGFDESNHLGRLALFGRWFDGQIESPLPTQPVHWPPGWHIAALGAFRLTHAHRGVVMLSAFFVVLTMIAAYLIGKSTAGNGVGAAAAIITAGTPVCAAYGRFATPDAMLMAATTWSIYFLLLSDGLRRRAYSLASGAACGAAMMTKGYAFIYLIGPVAVTLISHWRVNKYLSARWMGPALFVLGFFTICGGWFIPRLGDLVDILLFHATDYSEAYRIGYTDARIFFLSEFAGHWSIPLTAAIICAVVALIADRNRPPQTWLILSWFAFPALVFAFAPATYSRFLFPCLPASALLVAIFLGRLQKRWVALVALTAICVYMIALGSVLSFNPASWGPHLKLFAHPPLRAAAVEKQMETLATQGPLLITVWQEHPYLTSGLVDYLAFIHVPKTPVMVWSAQRECGGDELCEPSQNPAVVDFINSARPRILSLHKAPVVLPKGYSTARKLTPPPPEFLLHVRVDLFLSEVAQ